MIQICAGPLQPAEGLKQYRRDTAPIIDIEALYQCLQVQAFDCHLGKIKTTAFTIVFPTNDLVDNVLFLPEATGNSFWLNGSVWELPTFENADTFIARHDAELVYELQLAMGAPR